MALTDTQKAQIRQYLGWERGYDLNSKLEDKMLNLIAAEETLVTAQLTRLTALETALDTLVTNGSQRVTRVDEIEFSAERDPLAQLQEHGRRLVARLTALLGVGINRDYFGDGGAPLANLIPLG